MLLRWADTILNHFKALRGRSFIQSREEKALDFFIKNLNYGLSMLDSNYQFSTVSDKDHADDLSRIEVRNLIELVNSFRVELGRFWELYDIQLIKLSEALDLRYPFSKVKRLASIMEDERRVVESPLLTDDKIFNALILSCRNVQHLAELELASRAFQMVAYPIPAQFMDMRRSDLAQWRPLLPSNLQTAMDHLLANQFTKANVLMEFEKIMAKAEIFH